MTLVDVETYAEQYPCDDLVDNLEPARLVTTWYYLFSDSGTQSEGKKKKLPTRQKYVYFVLKIEVSIYFSEFGETASSRSSDFSFFLSRWVGADSRRVSHCTFV